MKNSLTLLLTCAALAIAAASCKPESKLDPTPSPKPEPGKKVPVEQTFNVKAGDIVNVEFESYAAWSASADAEWISFTPAEGEAGEGTIICTIGSQKPSFNNVAKGTLAIAVEGQAYNMTFLREATPRATRITDANGNPIDKLIFDANAEGGLSIQLTVEANYYWDLDKTLWPLWINNPGRTEGTLEEDGIYRKTFTLSINEAEAGDTDKSNEIAFTDLDDETYTYRKTLAVEYKAKVVPDDSFAIICDLGQEVHITPAGLYKDKEGNIITDRFSLDFSIDVEDPSQYVTVTCNGVKYDDKGHSSLNDNNYPFISFYPSMSDPGNPKAFSALAMPTIIPPDLYYDMGYIFILPEKIWKPYEQWKDSKELYMRMLIGGVFFNDLKNESGESVYDKHNILVKELKPELEKYTIRVYIDKE